MLEAISSIEAEASSAEEACSVAPCDSCSELADSSWLPEETLSAAESASATTPRRRSTMLSSDRPSVSLPESGFGVTVRSPLAIWSAMAAVLRRLPVITLIVSTRSLISSFVLISTVWSRSPTATASATVLIFFRPLLMPSASQMAAPTASSSAAPAIVTIRLRVWAYCASASSSAVTSSALLFSMRASIVSSISSIRRRLSVVARRSASAELPEPASARTWSSMRMSCFSLSPMACHCWRAAGSLDSRTSVSRVSSKPLR